MENHGFFRCSTVQYVSRHKTRVLSRGSSFRYSGKTQKQMVEFVRDNYVKRQTFQRYVMHEFFTKLLGVLAEGKSTVMELFQCFQCLAKSMFFICFL